MERDMFRMTGRLELCYDDRLEQGVKFKDVDIILMCDAEQARELVNRLNDQYAGEVTAAPLVPQPEKAITTAPKDPVASLLYGSYVEWVGNEPQGGHFRGLTQDKKYALVCRNKTGTIIKVLTANLRIPGVTYA